MSRATLGDLIREARRLCPKKRPWSAKLEDDARMLLRAARFPEDFVDLAAAAPRLIPALLDALDEVEAEIAALESARRHVVQVPIIPIEHEDEAALDKFIAEKTQPLKTRPLK